MESRIIKFKPLDDQSRMNGSSKVGDLKLSFEKLIGTFGEPNFGSDGYKTDVEWGIEFDDGTLASIYNYKNGRKYNGQYGLDVKDISDWSIGGFDDKSYNRVMDTISAKYMGKDVELKDGDYTLVDGNAWFTIKKFSVRIHSTDEGIIADVWVKGKEDEDVIASTYAFDHECEED